MELDYFVIGGVAVFIVGFVVWSRTRKRSKPSEVYMGEPVDPTDRPVGGPFADVRKEIEKLTKAEIIQKAKDDFGVNINVNLNKKDTVDAYMRLYRRG